MDPRHMTGKRKITVGTAKHPLVLSYIAQSDKGLLGLPAELRNRIFEMVCGDTIMKYKRRDPVARKSGMPKPPGFMMVCKQVYSESVQVLYATATYEFSTFIRLRSWLRTISSANLDMAGHVMLRGYEVGIKHLKREKEHDGSLFGWPADGSSKWTWSSVDRSGEGRKNRKLLY